MKHLVWLFLLISQTAFADYLYVVSTPDTTTKPPLTVNGGQVVAVIPQIRTSLWSLWEAWGMINTRPNTYYRATVTRQVFTSGRLLWTFKADSDLWFKYLTLWAASDGTVQGPIRLYNAQSLTQTQCEAVSSRTLVGATTDAGTLRPPPPITVCTKTSDAGMPYNCSQQAQTWPDAGLYLRCGTGGYYMRQWKYGGGLKETDPDPGAPGDPPTGNGTPLPPTGVAADVWDIPPAPTTHTCELPLGTPCP